MNEEELNDIVEIFTSILLFIVLLFIPFIIVNAMKLRKEEEILPPPEETWYEITINNISNSNDLTNYQVLLEINNDEQFFNDFNNDRKTIEAYDEDKSTSISFYVEEWDIVNHNAKIWLKIPFIPANSIKKVYLKANLDRTVSLSNPYETFNWFESFEEYDLGDLVGQNGWMQSGSRGSAQVTNATSFHGEKSAMCYHDASTDYRSAVHSLPLQSNFKLIVKWKLTDKGYATGSEGHIDFIYSGNIIIQTGYMDNSKNAFFYTYDGSDIWTSKPLIMDEWVTFKYLVDETGLKWLVNDDELISISENMFDALRLFGDEGCRMFIDYIIQMKYSSPEPTVNYSKI